MAVIVFLHDNLAIKTYPLDRNGLRLGRNSACDVFIDDKLVSTEHAFIEAVDSPETNGSLEYYIKDLNSTNQTYVNGEPVARKKLYNNDSIRIGRHSFKFIDETGSEDEKTLKLRKSWIPGVYYTKDEA